MVACYITSVRTTPRRNYILSLFSLHYQLQWIQFWAFIVFLHATKMLKSLDTYLPAKQLTLSYLMQVCQPKGRREACVNSDNVRIRQSYKRCPWYRHSQSCWKAPWWGWNKGPGDPCRQKCHLDAHPCTKMNQTLSFRLLTWLNSSPPETHGWLKLFSGQALHTFGPFCIVFVLHLNIIALLLYCI